MNNSPALRDYERWKRGLARAVCQETSSLVEKSSWNEGDVERDVKDHRSLGGCRTMTREDADFFFGEVGFSAIFSPSKCLLHGEEQSLFRLSINRFASSEFNRLLLHRSFVSSAERE